MPRAHKIEDYTQAEFAAYLENVFCMSLQQADAAPVVRHESTDGEHCYEEAFVVYAESCFNRERYFAVSQAIIDTIKEPTK